MPRPRLSRDYRVLVQDAADERVWSEVAGASKRLQALAQSGRELDPAFPALLSDLWASYYKAAPAFRPVAACDPESQGNRDVLSRLMDGPEHQAMRTTTMLDDLSSAIATRAAGEALLKARMEVGPPPPPPPLRRGTEVDAPRYGRALPGRVDVEGEVVGEEADDGACGDGGTAPASDPREVRRAARAAREAAQEAVDRVEEACAGWGIGSGELQYMPLSGRLDLVERLVNDARLRGFAAIVGRFRTLANARWRRRLVPKPQRLVGVTLGGDVARAVPVEVAALRHPSLRYDALHRLVERQLRQWDHRGRERKGRGPMIVCCDTSGSTRGAKDFTIKAVALGLLEIAWKQRRAFAGIAFSDRGEIDTTEFEPGRRDIGKLLHFATVWYGGGTDFDTPLDKAMELQRQSAYDKADVVFLTDGLAPIEPGFLERFRAEKRARDVRVLCVLADTGHYARQTVLSFADEVVQATDFETIAAEVFDWAAAER